LELKGRDKWLRLLESNQLPSAYEADELPMLQGAKLWGFVSRPLPRETFANYEFFATICEQAGQSVQNAQSSVADGFLWAAFLRGLPPVEDGVADARRRFRHVRRLGVADDPACGFLINFVSSRFDWHLRLLVNF
jgi:hypothetical protein